MGFNSAFKGLKLLKPRERAFKQFKNPGNGRLNNLNDPVLNVLSCMSLQQLLKKLTYFTESEEQYCLSAQNPVSDSIRSKKFLDHNPFLQYPFYLYPRSNSKLYQVLFIRRFPKAVFVKLLK